MLGRTAAAALMLASLAAGSEALAQAPGATPGGAASAATAAPRLVEVRLALSAPATDNLGDARVRRLVEIELEESALLAPGTAGPLGDHVAYVWIDLPASDRVLVEVRIGERAVSRRELLVSGLAWDVAARFVAIAVSEMVRAQMRPVRVRKPTPPRGPSPEELERAQRDATRVFVAGAFDAVALPGAAGAVAGPGIALGLRSKRLGESVGARWLAGSTEAGTTRWLDVGVTADYRLWPTPAWRVALGGAASLAALRLADARTVDDASDVDTWSARAVVVVAAERRLADAAWLGLRLEPGAILRSARWTDAGGASGMLGGAWLGMALTLALER